MTQIYSLDNANKQKALGNPTNDILNRFLDSVGDGSGTKDMAAAADIYYLTPPDGLVYVVDSLRITLGDATSFDADGFGGGAALATGCLLKLEEFNDVAAVIHDFTDAVPIKSHEELAALGRLEVSDGLVQTPGCLVRCTIPWFEEGAPVRINGSKDERLAFTVADSLAGLTKMFVFAQGRIFKDVS